MSKLVQHARKEYVAQRITVEGEIAAPDMKTATDATGKKGMPTVAEKLAGNREAKLSQ